MTREECLDLCDDLVFADDLDDAIVGVAQRFNETFVVYDRSKVLGIFMARDGMTEEQAVEFFEFNVVGAYVDGGPAFIETIRREPEPKPLVVDVVHISTQSEHTVVDANGKTWSFSWHDFLGPTVLRGDGQPFARQPGIRSPFWPALTAWQTSRR